MFGLLQAIVVVSVVQKAKKDNRKKPFALLQFLAVAAVGMFLL